MKSMMQPASVNRVRPEPSWKAVLESVSIEVFETMAGAHLVPVSVFDREPGGDRTAMVGLAGALRGMTTIRCSHQSAEKFAKHMLGGKAALDSTAVCGALGELCNRIAGNFKSKFSNLVDRCMLSVPTVISGADYSTCVVNSAEIIQVALKSEEELVWISLIIHN